MYELDNYCIDAKSSYFYFLLNFKLKVVLRFIPLALQWWYSPVTEHMAYKL